MIDKLLASVVGPYVLPLLAALFISLGLTISYLNLKLASAKAEARAAVIERDVAKSALESAGMTIATLRIANDELANGRAADQKAAADAVTSLNKLRQETAASIQAAQSARTAIYAQDSTAAEWSRQPVPAAIADRLRK